MKAFYEKIPNKDDVSFLARKISVQNFDAPLHFHPEYELTLILCGNGKRFVGDSVENFDYGDLVLLGSNLPHFWRTDKALQEKNTISEAIVVQFSTDFVNNILEKLPECKLIISMLNLAKSGIKFSDSLTILFEKLITENGTKRLLLLIEILEKLSQSTNYQTLASKNFNIKPDDSENERMRKILEFTLDNFQNEITIREMADLANLTVPSFCRYFKSRTRKTFIDYLNEIRVSHARKLLINSELGISQIGLECGFQNLSNFHRIFKNQVGITPLAYRKHF
ncbi:HTH-type transcriptional activator RhaR [Emticicia aquatica]|jgi:AraC-like DNA-binding protein|uniref:HTH-type transcriptional activator RhaR n=1 Tax=Emticicia aquatica TaxID=1681835 RepID=A0ABM9ARK9_9BACT|nr:AraC family transcriptional regulator [Emticicia aquatica]CAH0996371.1 HTH-type transcriptional activator RhaR [Emticicia aquatica]